MTRPPRRPWRRRLLLPLGVLAIVGGGWAAYAATTGTSHDYRTASATIGDVSATLDLSGTVSASGTADLVASASGDVVAVPVEVGEQVRRGQVIARLDQTGLVAEVRSARAGLAKAEAQLASDEDAQTSSVTTASTTSARSTTRSATVVGARRSTSGTSGTSSTATLIATIRNDQAAVTKAQTAASTALATAADALSTEESACAGTSTATSSPTSSASDASTDTATASASPSTGSQAGDECQTALGAVQSAQAAVSDAQTMLKTALDTLTTDLAKASAATSTSPSGSPSSGMPSGSSGGGSASSGSSGSSGTSVTAATLARDQASIDQARAELVGAIAARKAAVVRAPSAGQVRSLSVAKGDAVSTGDDIAVVVGKGLTTVEIAATQAQAAQLRLGGTASVTPAGSTSALTGRVARIAHVPTTSTSTTSTSTSSTYAVEVTLTGRPASHPPLGMPVAVSVVIGTAKQVVTVPASAVSNGSVEVLRNGVATRTRVTTGVVGTSTIQVLSGVSAGDRVVLADLDQALPSSDSSSTRTGFGRTGGFGGSGGFGGGEVGGPPGMG